MNIDHWFISWKHEDHPVDIDQKSYNTGKQKGVIEPFKALPLNISDPKSCQQNCKPQWINRIVMKCLNRMQCYKSPKGPCDAASRAWISAQQYHRAETVEQEIKYSPQNSYYDDKCRVFAQIFNYSTCNDVKCISQNLYYSFKLLLSLLFLKHS